MKKFSLFLLCLLVGGVQAASTDTFHWEKNEHEYYTIMIEKQCDHQWEKSRYFLMENTGNRPSEDILDKDGHVAGKRTYQDRRVFVEVCRRCGLIQVNPKELK